MRGLIECVVIVLMVVWIVNSEGARPFATDDAGVVESAGYELEMGYDFGQDEGELGIGFKHGLTQKMDIGVGFGYTVVSEPNNRPTTAELCLKYLLIPNLLAASITNELGAAGYDINTILMKVFEPIELNANFGYSATGDTAAGAIFYALAMIAGFEKFDFGAESSGDKDGLQNWLVGGRYKLLEGLNLDIGVSGGLKTDRAIIGTAGLHYEF